MNNIAKNIFGILMNDEYPHRSKSHDESNEEFPLPRHQGNDVPECQIIVLEKVEWYVFFIRFL